MMEKKLKNNRLPQPEARNQRYLTQSFFNKTDPSRTFRVAYMRDGSTTKIDPSSIHERGRPTLSGQPASACDSRSWPHLADKYI
jgi:hypothetical protein